MFISVFVLFVFISFFNFFFYNQMPRESFEFTKGRTTLQCRHGNGLPWVTPHPHGTVTKTRGLCGSHHPARSFRLIFCFKGHQRIRVKLHHKCQRPIKENCIFKKVIAFVELHLYSLFPSVCFFFFFGCMCACVRACVRACVCVCVRGREVRQPFCMC